MRHPWLPVFSVYLFDVCANGCPHIAFIVIIIIGTG